MGTLGNGNVDAGKALRSRNVMALAHAVQHVFAMSIPPLLVFIQADLQFSWTELGVAVAAGYITSGLIQFVSGFLVDKFGVKRVLVGGFSLLLLGLFCLSRSHILQMMVFSQILFGIGNSTFHPASFAEVSKATRHRGLGMGMAWHNIGGNVGGAAAYSIAALLATWLGWRTAIIVMVAGGAVLTVIFAASYREMPDLEVEEDDVGDIDADKLQSEVAAASDQANENSDSNSNLSDVRKWLPVILVAAAALLSGVFSRGLNTFLPTFLTTVRGASGAVAGMLSTILLLSGAGGSFLGGKLGDERNRKQVVLFSSVITALFVFVLVRFPLTGLPLILVLIAIGFSLSVARPCLNAITSEVSPGGKTGTAFGVVFGVMSLGGSGITPVIGYIADHFSLQLGFVLLAVAFLLHGLLMQKVNTSKDNGNGELERT